MPIFDAIRGRMSLEVLNLHGNRIRDVGGESIATLLQDSNCNLHYLGLQSNLIDKDGLTAIANSLVKNTKMRELYLQCNRSTIYEPYSDEMNAFSEVLCNTSHTCRITQLKSYIYLFNYIGGGSLQCY